MGVPLALLVLALAGGPLGAPAALAQSCTDGVPDGTLCDDDLDPCTYDRCDDGVCEHPQVGFVAACTPVLTPFQRVLVLTPFAAELAGRVAALPVGDPPAFTVGQRDAIGQDLADLASGLDRLQRTLGGASAGVGDTAQERAKAALPEADAAVRSAALVRDLVRAARRVEQFSPATARVLDRSTADLVRGAKAVRRDLRRLRKVSQVFQS